MKQKKQHNIKNNYPPKKMTLPKVNINLGDRNLGQVAGGASDGVVGLILTAKRMPRPEA